MGEEFGLSRLDKRKRTWSWGLCDYLVVLVEDRVWITVPIVSCDITTCVVMSGVCYSGWFTCFGVAGVGRWFYDLLLIKFKFKTS